MAHINNAGLFWSRFSLTVVIALVCTDSNAQKSILDAGVRLQKSVSLYNENGISVQYSAAALKPDRLYFGFAYVTSRLGTALGTNAIKQDNLLLSASWYLRKERLLRPYGRLNVGYFRANYEDAVFDVLPSKSFILSPELGVGVSPDYPIKIGVSVGYNLITGDGLDGPGTLYPVFIQTTATWSLLSK